MKAFKKAISVLSYICIVVIILFVICSLPLIWGHKPMPVTDDHLGKSFPVGSMFYYGKADISELEAGYAVVYKDAEGGKNVGIIKGTDGDVVTVYMKITAENGENKGSVEVPVSYSTAVLGINKTSNLPLIGGFYSFISGHVFIIILIGLVLVLRIALIYVDPEMLFKKGGVKTEERPADTKDNDVFANMFSGKNDHNEAVSDMHSIFSNAADAEDAPDDEPAPAEPSKETEILDVNKESAPEAAPAPEVTEKNSASEITDYINALAFDSKDDDWYSASQVDEALDVITSKVYDALNKAKDNEISEGELRKLRDDKAELEKKYLVAEAELASANDRIAECEKAIEGYKEMEKKVAKLLAALKAEKKNG